MDNDLLFTSSVFSFGNFGNIGAEIHKVVQLFIANSQTWAASRISANSTIFSFQKSKKKSILARVSTILAWNDAKYGSRSIHGRL